ncbi:FAD-dependent oxidoreductase [Pelomonas sp. Root1217]|uniref:FAD-dependent oxidoreductase n=1 Tax=Pelomonas sp. Root1217 TaxID=1736430 RepID=UPI00070F56AE|nr:FAD-dependent oxidoreductase [Pelomonas sp. Root1217]KQV48837.1 FAD-dependent oxidoreductase [Pelomonas sp. Root1217]
MACATLGYGSDGKTIQAFEFDYRRSPDQDAAAPVRHRVVVVGGGPVGLSLAIDLAQRGQRVLLLDNDSRLSTGSRAICFAKRTLEIWDRLGVGNAMCAKGVGWNVGRVFFGDEQLYRFDLLPEEGHERPAFINLQQYYAEAFLAVRAADLANLEIRWKNSVVALEQDADGVRLGIGTPDGRYTIAADHVIACDGSRSPLRALLGQESKGRTFRDRFLIADIRMQAEAAAFPAERWFWFDPPFHPNQSVLLHRQPDGVWRIDFQLGWDADPEEERKPEKIKPRVDAMLRQALGREVPFELEWASVYTFACLRMERFRLGPVLFAGDSAHGVSPFGARGANSGVQDAENLAWKLDAVLRGAAGDSLLDSYAEEREYAADENILNSTRATDFITPKSEISRLFRDAVLQLSKSHPFARTLVNSGRLSVPATLHGSPLNTPDGDAFAGLMVPGAAAVDAPVRLPNQQRGWLLRQLGSGFTLLLAAGEGSAALAAQPSDRQLPVRLDVLTIALPAAVDGRAALADVDGLVAQRYDLQPGNAVLLRPDHHVCARWRRPDAAAVARAVTRALASH